MRILGFLVFGLGVLVLGWYATTRNAADIERAITADANAMAPNAIHPVVTTVSGRDIVLTGLADTQNEAEALIAAANAIEGRRVVRADLTVLPAVESYTLNAVKSEAGITATGNTPTAATATFMAAETGVSDLEALTLASGAPDNWSGAVIAGVNALDQLDEGTLDMRGEVMFLAGQAPDAVTREQIVEAISAVEGFDVTTEITVPFVYVPAEMTVRFDRIRGLFVNGTAPEQASAASVAGALGMSAVTGSFRSDAATTQLAPLTRALEELADALPEFETAVLTMNDEVVTLSGETLTEVDIDLLGARLRQSGVFSSVDLTQAEERYAEGDRRLNRLTGEEEELTSGFWLPVVDVGNASTEACTDASQAELEAGRIQFLTNEATLDATSRATLSTLAAIVTVCFDENPALRLEVGGHTDSVGSDQANLALSLARAERVAQALVARGVDPSRLTTQGYGETEPVSDNETEEGRSQNRRTTFRWSA